MNDNESIKPKEVARYMCPAHGEHNANMLIEIYGVKKANYCLLCLMEKFDSIGIHQLKDVEP